MPLDPKRKGDIKVLVGATVAVLLVGFFIAGAMFVTTRSKTIHCGQLDLGLATGVRAQLGDGPYFTTGGGKCSFWVALENGDIVAYKASQPSRVHPPSCTLVLKLDHWSCGGKTVPVSRLAQYPVSIQTVNGVDAVIVNLGTPRPVEITTNAGTSPTTTTIPTTGVPTTAAPTTGGLANPKP